MTSENEVLPKILSEFECPVCYQYMCPPMYSCRNGHRLCHSCKARISTCPQCRDPDFRRDLAAENIFAKLRFPCRCKNEGCQILFDNFGDKRRHEINRCRFDTTRSCPLSMRPCTWTGKYEDMSKHIEECHSSTVKDHGFCINSFNFSLALPVGKRKIWLIRAFSKYFRVILERSNVNEGKIAVQFVEGCYDDTKFLYTTQFCGPRSYKFCMAKKCQILECIDTAFYIGNYSKISDYSDNLNKFCHFTIYITKEGEQ